MWKSTLNFVLDIVPPLVKLSEEITWEDPDRLYMQTKEKAIEAYAANQIALGTLMTEFTYFLKHR